MEKLPRPKVVFGINVKVVTSCGNMYVQMGWCNGRLFEVFATLGRGGGCAMGFSEALTRSITLGLRCGVPPSEYAKQLRGVMCPSPRPFPKEEAVLSCPDAIGKVVEQFGNATSQEIIDLIALLSQDDMITRDDDDEEEAAADAKRQLESLQAARRKLEEVEGT
jgi:ribonucleoside-diphosphate reductase alpha chain